MPRRVAVRPWIRALHRDLGYLGVGLTFVYAASGLAVNHVEDWDPNFRNDTRTVELGGPLPEGDAAASEAVLGRLGVREEPREVYRAAPDQLDIVFERRTLHVDTRKGSVVDESQTPRFFLKTANWLHLNRGKRAWTRVADAYAVALLALAISGVFMLPGRKGLLGRGALLVGVGVAIPVAYVALAR